MKIFKYILNSDTDENQPISIPVEHGIVDVQTQDNKITFWEMVEEVSGYQTFKFGVFGTGHIIPNDYEYIGTTQQYGGMYVWHIFKYIGQ